MKADTARERAEQNVKSAVEWLTREYTDDSDRCTNLRLAQDAARRAHEYYAIAAELDAVAAQLADAICKAVQDATGRGTA